MTYYLAIDIGGTNIKYGLIDEEENLIESHEMPTEAEQGGPGILRTTKALVESSIEENHILGVCISSAGMVDPDKGEIFYAGPQIPNYAGTQFKKEIEENQIQIHIECPEKPVMAETNIEQMNKALGSILKNSIYALLRKLQKQSFSPFITIKLEERGNNTVFISIYDNGIGIEDSIKDKIFEPFFTTKPSAEAAGVGLYLCREVILNHQGSILAKSEKDNYTEFLITIPISQKRINNE